METWSTKICLRTWRSLKHRVENFSQLLQLGWTSEDDAWDNLLCPRRRFFSLPVCSDVSAGHAGWSYSKKVPPPAIQTHKFTTEESAEHTWHRLPVHVCMLNPEGLLTEQAGTWLDHEKLYIISMSIFNPLEEDETCLLWVKRYSSYFTEELHRAGSLYNTDVIKCFI